MTSEQIINIAAKQQGYVHSLQATSIVIKCPSISQAEKFREELTKKNIEHYSIQTEWTSVKFQKNDKNKTQATTDNAPYVKWV